MEYSAIFDLMFKNVKKILYPEEWISLDSSFSKSEIFAMLIVERHGEIIMSQVADYINIPMSTATGIVDRLVKNGYLERARSESDRRIVVIKLTGKGSAMVSGLKHTIMDYVNSVNESLTDEERQLLYRIFTKVVDVIEKRNTQIEAVSQEEKVIRKIEIK